MSTHRTGLFLGGEECGGAGRRVYRVREVTRERCVSMLFLLPIRCHWRYTSDSL